MDIQTALSILSNKISELENEIAAKTSEKESYQLASGILSGTYKAEFETIANQQTEIENKNTEISNANSENIRLFNLVRTYEADMIGLKATISALQEKQ
ncbi:MAG: hypothetical protein L6Q29_03415 [Candidatus Pacebacteria bacterium]|nr:hypothetical protein [Candidatus Paceibacterota bacterium]